MRRRISCLIWSQNSCQATSPIFSVGNRDALVSWQDSGILGPSPLQSRSEDHSETALWSYRQSWNECSAFLRWVTGVQNLSELHLPLFYKPQIISKFKKFLIDMLENASPSNHFPVSFFPSQQLFSHLTKHLFSIHHFAVVNCPRHTR